MTDRTIYRPPQRSTTVPIQRVWSCQSFECLDYLTFLVPLLIKMITRIKGATMAMQNMTDMRRRTGIVVISWYRGCAALLTPRIKLTEKRSTRSSGHPFRLAKGRRPYVASKSDSIAFSTERGSDLAVGFQQSVRSWASASCQRYLPPQCATFAPDPN